MPTRLRFYMTGFVVAALALGATVRGQEVTLSPRLRAGDAFRLELARRRENSARPQLDATSRTTIDVRVVTASADGFVVEWSAGETTFDNPQLAQDPMLLAAAEALEGLQLRLRLNAEGEFTGVSDEAQLTSRLQTAVDTIVRGLMKTVPPEQQKAVQGLLAQALSPAVVIASATREAQIYFGLSGVTLAAGKTVEAPIDQPSPIGGGTVAGTFRITADSVTPAAAVVRTAIVYDGAALVRLTRQLLEQQLGKPIPDEELAKLPPFEMGDDARYVFDRETGLMREVIVNRRFNAGPQRRVDRWEIRLLTPPAR